MRRRDFIKSGLIGLGLAIVAPYMRRLAAAEVPVVVPPLAAGDKIDKLDLPDSEWKKRLTSAQYDILRDEGTEHPFTSALLGEHREGVFACAGCDLPLFPSKFKFDSGTGWPSFYDTIAGHLEQKVDHKMFVARNEYHCARCGGHHGHVFNDGPPPTGLRYCNNGAVLKFIPKES